MPAKFPYRVNDEPVPGYRVVKFLGKGNFGEVWQAKAPGGASVALKVIPDLSSKQAHKEFLALGIIKNLHHPNLVSINAVWLKDGQGIILDDSMVDSDRLPAGFGGGGDSTTGTIQVPSVASNPMLCELIIAMGLGHKNLFDRLEECKTAGMPGIPTEELLDYMEEAAKAIDYLNGDREEDGVKRSGVQHCDIKPYNILITGTSAQVCDFGLARVQGAVRATASLSGTVAYAAPECLEESGNPSATTDQYSLAVSYYELKTGLLPYSQTTMFAIMQASLAGQLDLSQISPAEESVLRRATARNPSKRFPSSVAMVKALRRAAENVHEAPTVEVSKTAAPARTWNWLMGVPVLIAAVAIGWWAFHNDQDKNDQKDITQQQIAKPDRPANNVVKQQRPVDISDKGSDSIEAEKNDTTPPVADDALGERMKVAGQFAIAGDLDAAIDEYTKAIALEPSSAAAHFERGVVLAKQSQLNKAIDDFQRARQLDLSDALKLADRPEPASAFLERARQRRENRDYTGSREDCQVVIQQYPKSAGEAYAEQGALERDQHNYPDAIKDLSEAIRLSPQNALAYSRRGYVYLQTSQFNDALADLDVALQLDPNDIDYLNRAIAYSAAGKLTEALTELNALVARDPTNNSALYQRGLVYRDLMKYSDAVADLRAVQAQEPDDANTLAVLAVLLACAPDADDSNIEEAIRLATSACTLSERKDPMHLDALAATLAKKGVFPEAEKAAQSAVELAHGSPAETLYKQRLELYQAGQPYILPSAP